MMGNTLRDLWKKIGRFGVLAILLVWCVCTTSAQKKVTPKKQMAHKSLASKAPRKKSPAKGLHSAKSVAQLPKTAAANKANAPAKAAGSAAPAAELRAVAETTHGRDPFAALVHSGDPGGHTNLPPGIAGLQVATVELQGTVKSSDGMVAVVANPQDRVYFLHDGDHVYDGVVSKISPGEITFQQESKDPFGRTVEREVTKRLYPIAGDAQ